MKKSERMKVVADLANRKEQEALELLAQARKYRDSQVSQLDSLKQYHRQYTDEMTPKVGGTVNVAQLQANIQFINQIDLAISQQEKVLATAQNQFQHALNQWTELHQKRKGLDDLISRMRKDEISAQDKLEQKQIEDMYLARFSVLR